VFLLRRPRSLEWCCKLLLRVALIPLGHSVAELAVLITRDGALRATESFARTSHFAPSLRDSHAARHHRRQHRHLAPVSLALRLRRPLLLLGTSGREMMSVRESAEVPLCVRRPQSSFTP